MGDDERMDATSARRAFLAEQIGSLPPFGFVIVSATAPPQPSVRVHRSEEGRLRVDAGVPGEGTTGLTPEQTKVLAGVGLVEETGVWATECDSAAGAVELVERVLVEAFGADPAAQVEVRHGSTQAEHEAAQRIAKVREQVEPVLASILGRPAEKDDDGDYVLDIGAKRLYLAVRAAPGRPSVIRVFAITNVGVAVTGELALFLSRLNFDLMFGRFALDAEHGAVWFDEALLGEHVDDEELRFTIEMVAETANAWDVRIAQAFGGRVRRTDDAPPPPSEPTNKPGQAGYL